MSAPRHWQEEQLISAHSAAYALSIPPRWLTDPSERRRRRVPHYRVGALVRFRLEELVRWMQQQSKVNTARRIYDAGLQ